MTRPVAPLLLAVTAALALGGCGRIADLAFVPGQPGPAMPVGATVAPTPESMTSPSTQAQPKRSDELLRQSQEREADPFDLPPA